MPGNIITQASQIQCPHGGTIANKPTSNTVVSVGKPPGLALLQSDIYTIVGCPFTIGPKPSPCVRTQWLAGAIKVTISGTQVIVDSSKLLCLSPEGAPQGFAIITNPQDKVSAQ